MKRKLLWKHRGEEAPLPEEKGMDQAAEKQEEEQEKESTEDQVEAAAKGPAAKGPAAEEPEKKMSIPGLIFNAVFLIFNGFVFAMIICLFLMQPHPGEKVKPTLNRFTTNAQDYYEEGETYHQVNANVKSYRSSGRPD
ncbi:MAG: hypothetical protein MR332_03390 [Fusicatenibacter sp.]|nr:hypothetical protein [Fusicatenibacter sp.]